MNLDIFGKNNEIILGDEYDEELFDKLKTILITLGFQLMDKENVIAGSQDITIWFFKVGDEELYVKSETYVGLSMAGSNTLIDNIVKLLKQ